MFLVTVLALAISSAFSAAALAEPPNEGNATLSEKLEQASTAWHDAKTKLDESLNKQNDLNRQIGELTTQVNDLSADVGQIASEAYLNGGPMEFAIALDSSSFSTLVDKMTFINQLTWQNERQISELKEKRGDLNEQRAKLDDEVRDYQKTEQDLAKARDDAQSALESVNGHPSMGYIDSGKPAATPAPRDSSGRLPDESCTADDPTGGPCLTPRTAHAFAEAQKVGFTNYASCNHAASWGEHPKGQACDMSAERSSFGGNATGDAKGYGNRLAAWFVENADALGVMYVIWYKQCWMPSTGWTNYDGGSDPSSAHTNHVHVSIL